MSLWNAANGPSIHAELIGREWVKMGHKLTVFSSIEHPDARPTNQSDEDYVIRHFKVEEVTPFTRATYFDPIPLVNEDYEVFVAENVERLPAYQLYRLFPVIQGKAKTVMVVHEGGPPNDPYYYKFKWDAIICFDERYLEFIEKFFPRNIIHIIPYPCHPFTPGDKSIAREKLALPKDLKIIFSYGFRPHDIVSILPAIEKINVKYPLKYIIFINPESDPTKLIDLTKKYPFINVRKTALPLNKLYDYLHASDALLFHRKSSRYKAVLSSSICLTLGSGCPILFNRCNFVEIYGKEIIKYRDNDDLITKLSKLFEEGFNLENVKKFLERRSSKVIADKYIYLFKKIISEDGDG